MNTGWSFLSRYLGSWCAHMTVQFQIPDIPPADRGRMLGHCPSCHKDLLVPYQRQQSPDGRNIYIMNIGEALEARE